jgi:hypothetical protein
MLCGCGCFSAGSPFPSSLGGCLLVTLLSWVWVSGVGEELSVMGVPRPSGGDRLERPPPLLAGIYEIRVEFNPAMGKPIEAAVATRELVCIRLPKDHLGLEILTCLGVILPCPAAGAREQLGATSEKLPLEREISSSKPSAGVYINLSSPPSWSGAKRFVMSRDMMARPEIGSSS